MNTLVNSCWRQAARFGSAARIRTLLSLICTRVYLFLPVFPLLALPAFAQNFTQPDCFQPVNFVGVAASPAFDNSSKGCNSWVFDYANEGFSVISIVVQTAPAIGPGISPGAWSTFTPITGINPNTSIVAAISTFGTNLTFFPFVRVNLTTATGSGVVQGTLYGWRIPASGSAGGGCVGTIATPCIVAGPNASGAPPTKSPVLISGQTGSDAGPGNVETVHVDALGNLQAAIIGNAAVLSGQQAVTAAAVALATNTVRNVCIKALVGNTINVYVGPVGVTDATGIELAPGDAVCLPVLNTNLLYVIASTTGNSVSWIGTN